MRDERGRGKSEGQRHDDDGRFTRVIDRGSYQVPLFGDEPLEHLVACKLTTEESRRCDILFDQHRDLFGWKTRSDMFRELLHVGFVLVFEQVKNPDPELLEIVDQYKELEKLQKRVNRHLHIEKVMRGFNEGIHEMEARRDYGAIRKALNEFYASIRTMKDPVLRTGCQQEFDRQWGALHKELKRGVSLNPKDFEYDD